MVPISQLIVSQMKITSGHVVPYGGMDDTFKECYWCHCVFNNQYFSEVFVLKTSIKQMVVIILILCKRVSA